MPVFEFECPDCKSKREASFPLEEVKDSKQIWLYCVCGSLMARKFTAPFVIARNGRTTRKTVSASF